MFKKKEKNQIIPERKEPVAPLVFFDRECDFIEDQSYNFININNSTMITQMSPSIFDHMRRYSMNGIELYHDKRGKEYEFIQNSKYRDKYLYDKLSQNKLYMVSSMNKQILDALYSTLYDNTVRHLTESNIIFDFRVLYNKIENEHHITSYKYNLYEVIKSGEFNEEFFDYFCGNMITNFQYTLISNISSFVYDYVRNLVYTNYHEDAPIDAYWVAISECITQDMLKFKDLLDTIICQIISDYCILTEISKNQNKKNRIEEENLF